jgi:hypothetical protein
MNEYLLGTAFRRNGQCRRFIVAVLLLLGFAAAAHAEPRVIFVNGERLNGAGIAYADRLNCGQLVPNGDYWLDMRRREWGYVGVPERNPLPDCSAASSRVKSSLAKER